MNINGDDPVRLNIVASQSNEIFLEAGALTLVIKLNKHFYSVTVTQPISTNEECKLSRGKKTYKSQITTIFEWGKKTSKDIRLQRQYATALNQLSYSTSEVLEQSLKQSSDRKYETVQLDLGSFIALVSQLNRPEISSCKFTAAE
jgi:hypothetical protein